MPAPRCPNCKKTIPPLAALDADGRPVRPSWAPFCSDRCKLADLQKWLGGAYAIPGKPLDEAELARAAPVSTRDTEDDA